MDFERFISPDMYSRKQKRMKFSSKGIMSSHRANVIDYSDPFAIPNLKEELDRGIYGSVTKDIEALRARRLQMLNPLLAMCPSISTNPADFSAHVGSSVNSKKEEPVHSEVNNQLVVIIDSDEEDGEDKTRAAPLANQAGSPRNIDLDKSRSHTNDSASVVPVVTQHQHETDRNAVTALTAAFEAKHQLSYQYQEVVLKKPNGEGPNGCWQMVAIKEEQGSLKKDKGVFIGVQDDPMSKKGVDQCDADDGLGDIWREMTLAMECSKDVTGESLNANQICEGDEEKDCEHSFVLKDDLGYVCRVCGVIQRSIETIFDYQWVKGTKTTRSYISESRSHRDREQNGAALFTGLDDSEATASGIEIFVHPRHMKQMKPHQIEGFNFLLRNLVSDEPGGCIMAHAPGSGKTFMIISFIQSFLAKYPNGRPLVVLPKGILSTWKKEFQRWQVEAIELYDFYSVKADNRCQQLFVLKQWIEHKGILFLGYKQFSSIVCDNTGSEAAAACHDILLKVPTILILDEGHTPRNDNTDVLQSLAEVQTPRKVVLSGTLFQNHVREVFNILNLVRPKFLKLDTSRDIKRRVLSRVQISGSRKLVKSSTDALFYDLVEDTLQNDENFKRKVTVIQDLREMTSKVLHYYKGDFLDELPGLVDITVLLNLNAKQKRMLENLKGMEKFKRYATGSAVYVHPLLKEFSENGTMGEKSCNLSDDKVDKLLNHVDVKEGVKTKFFLNLLALCDSAGEKLLVFSQYLLPLKFLERLIVRSKGWSPGKEIFSISGESSAEHREWSMERFNNSPDAKVLFGSIKACGEGISLVGASRLVLLDVHLNPSVSRQAVGRAFRPGQMRKVYVYRLVASDSQEEEFHHVCFRKELISKMWFEWSEYNSNNSFKMEKVDANDTDDVFWNSPLLREDVKVLYGR